jgi:hypothetical protein
MVFGIGAADSRSSKGAQIAGFRAPRIFEHVVSTHPAAAGTDQLFTWRTIYKSTQQSDGSNQHKLLPPGSSQMDLLLSD